jgi:acetyltransferase
VEIAERYGTAVALKVVSPDILHKSDFGGVKLNLKTRKEIIDAYKKIEANARKMRQDVRFLGCLVSPMVKKGLEVIIGTKIDDQFGPIIMFGLGGILVEIVKDVSFRVLPITRSAARRMIKEIKAAPILDGVRGEPPVDKEAIVNLLMAVSNLIESYPDIHELDLNPVIAHEHKISIVDARIILRENHRLTEGK